MPKHFSTDCQFLNQCRTFFLLFGFQLLVKCHLQLRDIVRAIVYLLSLFEKPTKHFLLWVCSCVPNIARFTVESSCTCSGSWILIFTPPAINITNSNSLRRRTCLLTSHEIRTTSLHQPAIYSVPSQAVIIIQIHSIPKVGGERSHEDEELQIISREAFCLNPATLTWVALRRLGDKQALEKHKGKEKRDNKLFHLNPHGEISLRNNQLLCRGETAVELAISNLIVPSTLIPNADKYGCEVFGERGCSRLGSGHLTASV